MHIQILGGENETEDVMVLVSDNGIGIPENELDRIFERFYRVDKSHSKETGGTGLGLSIVKHGAMIHHARIDVISKVGRGTTMTLIFPRSFEENAGKND